MCLVLYRVPVFCQVVKSICFSSIWAKGGRRKTISMFCLSFSCLYRVIHLSESHHFLTLFSTFWKQHFEKLNMFQTKTIFFVKNATFSIPVRSRHFLIFVVMLQAHEKMCKKTFFFCVQNKYLFFWRNWPKNKLLWKLIIMLVSFAEISDGFKQSFKSDILVQTLWNLKEHQGILLSSVKL